MALFFDTVLDAIKDKLAEKAANNVGAEAILETFASADLNTGQQYIAYENAIPAMISALRETISSGEPDEIYVAEAGYESHHAAFQALSSTIEEAASAGVEAAAQVMEEQTLMQANLYS